MGDGMTRLSTKDRGPCCYCGGRAECLDRILPRSSPALAGYIGLNIGNMRPSCMVCHDLRLLSGNCPAAMMAVRCVVNPLQVPGAARILEKTVAIAWFGARRPARLGRSIDLKLSVRRWPDLEHLHSAAAKRK